MAGRGKADSGAGKSLLQVLWQVYRRRQPPIPFVDGISFPWGDPEFSQRMLELHLDESHGAASRPAHEIALQSDAIWNWLGLSPGSRLLDVGCGPGLHACGLARRGVDVFGLDISPASLAYAQGLSPERLCHFYLADFHHVAIASQSIDAAIFLYGQFAAMPKDEALDVLDGISSALRSGGVLLLELLDPEKVDRSDSSWWFTDQGGLWGDFPYLHLGERHWDENQHASLERYYIVNLETGGMQEYTLADQVYRPGDIQKMAQSVGMELHHTYPAWAGLPLSDAGEWIVYLLRKKNAGDAE